MSLFNETVKRLSQAEARIGELERENANLKSQLAASEKAVGQVKRQLARPLTSSEAGWKFRDAPSRPPRDITALTDEEVEMQFARMTELVDVADLKSAAPSGVPVRSRLLALACSLLRPR